MEKGEGTVLEELFLLVTQMSHKQGVKLASKKCLLKLASQNQSKQKQNISSIRAKIYVRFMTSLEGSLENARCSVNNG